MIKHTIYRIVGTDKVAHKCREKGIRAMYLNPQRGKYRLAAGFLAGILTLFVVSGLYSQPQTNELALPEVSFQPRSESSFLSPTESALPSMSDADPQPQSEFARHSMSDADPQLQPEPARNSRSDGRPQPHSESSLQTQSGPVNSSNQTFSANLPDDCELAGTLVTCTYHSDDIFVVPAGVPTITVEAWGGGGGGGGSTTVISTGRMRGGGGGAYARSVLDVTTGSSHSVIVGSGGLGGNSALLVTVAGEDGSPSQFGDAPLVRAAGGEGGPGSTASGNNVSGGSAEAPFSIGDVTFRGGNGTAAGGGGAGSQGAGKDASGDNGGGATAAGGGAGGNSPIVPAIGGNDGNPGMVNGGGGSGASAFLISSASGGNGARGQVIVSYDLPEIDASESTVEAEPEMILANGVSTSEITVTLRYENGDQVPLGGENIFLTTTAGTLSNGGVPVDHNDGTYTLTLTSSTTAGMATVRAYLGTNDTGDLIGTADVNFIFDLQTAIDLTPQGGTLQLPAGTYEVSAALFIRNNKNITIAGQGAGAVIYQTGSDQRVFTIGENSGCDNQVVFQNLTIEGGNITSPGSDGGGGIRVNPGCRLTLEDSVIRNNRVTSASDARGGGIYNLDGYLTLIRTLITQNEALGTDSPGGNEVRGGGLYIHRRTGSEGGVLTAVESEISANSSRHHGGGMFVERGSAWLIHTDLSDNEAHKNSAAPRGEGGAAHLVSQAELVMFGGEISGNRAEGSGFEGAVQSAGGIQHQSDAESILRGVALQDNSGADAANTQIPSHIVLVSSTSDHHGNYWDDHPPASAEDPCLDSSCQTVLNLDIEGEGSAEFELSSGDTAFLAILHMLADTGYNGHHTPEEQFEDLVTASPYECESGTGPCSWSVPVSMILLFTAEPASGYEFTGWEGDSGFQDNLDNPAVVSIPGVAAFNGTAIFEMQAMTFYSRTTGNWPDPATWTLSNTHTGDPVPRAPGPDDQMVIAGAGNDEHRVSLTNNTVNHASVSVHAAGMLDLGDYVISGQGQFTLEAGAVLLIGSADGIDEEGSSGNIQVEGTILFNPGASYMYIGSEAQQTGSGLPAAINNLTIDNPAGVSAQSNHTITGQLFLADGTFTMPSGSSLVVDHDGVNADLGTIRMQKTIHGEQGWRMISTPVHTTYQDLLSEFVTQGFDGSTFQHLQPNLLWFDETDAGTTLQGWRQPGNIAENVEGGRGHFHYIFDGAGRSDQPDTYHDTLPRTLTAAGLPFGYTGNAFHFGLTYTGRDANAGQSGGHWTDINESDEGWNLIGNPVTATLDWDADGWTRTNVDHTIYIWDPEANGGNGEYLVWNGVNGTLDGGLIAPFQAFWIRAHDENPVLAFTDDVKTTGGEFTGSTAAKKADNNRPESAPALIMDLSIGEMTSRSMISLMQEGRIGPDRWDAYRLQPMSENWLTLFTSSPEGGQPLVINNLPDRLDQDIMLPLHIGGAEQGEPLGGQFTLTWQLPDHWPVDLYVTLMDHETREAISMNERSEYRFTYSTPASMGKSRVEFDHTGFRQPPTFNTAGSTSTIGTPPIVAAEARERSSGDTAGNVSTTGSLPGMAAVAGKSGINRGAHQDLPAQPELDTPFSIVMNRAADEPYLMKNGMDTRFSILLSKQKNSDSYLPDEIHLHQNYPNPFNPSTTIRYSLPSESEVRLDVYDLLGRRVATLVNTTVAAGTHQVVWDADNHASGVYIYQLTAGNKMITEKMILLK